jgi:hypothetical protein
MIRDMRPRTGDYAKHNQGLHDFCEMLSLHFMGECNYMVEVGCWKGESALIFADYVGDVLCIDNWACPLPEDCGYSMEDVYQAFLMNTRHRPSIRHIRLASLDAAPLFEDGSRDCVYIDASHIYSNVKADILAWRSKVRKGGVIAGHDYHESVCHGDVMRAVNEVFGKPDRTFQDNTWMIYV